MAIQAALEKMLKLKTLKLLGSSTMIGSDSKSLITALERGPLIQNDRLLSKIWDLLIILVETRGMSKVVFQFVYSHCGVEKNEVADRLAEEALRKYKAVDQRKAPIPLQAVKALVKQGPRRNGRRNLTLADTGLRHVGVKAQI